MKEELIKKAARHFLFPLGFVQIIFLLMIIASPFIWIWEGCSLCWRLFLTGLIGASIISIIYNFLKNLISEVVEKHLSKNKE